MMTDADSTERKGRLRWDTLLAACSAAPLLQRVSIYPWWASAIIWGALSGAFYYSARWLFDRYRLGRAAKTAIILVAWLIAIIAGAVFEVNAPADLFPPDRMGRRRVTIPGFESAVNQATAFGDRSGDAARSFATAGQRALQLLTEQQTSKTQLQDRLSAISVTLASLEAAMQAHAVFREFVLANQSEILNSVEGALLVRIAEMCPAEYSEFAAAFGNFLRRARLLDDYALLNWEALQTAAGGSMAAYDQLFSDLDAARERYNAAYSSHQTCIAAAAVDDPELGQIVGEVQREVGRH
jgi:hypothetical protein